MLLSVLAAGSSFEILAADGSHTSNNATDAQLTAREERLAVRLFTSAGRVLCGSAAFGAGLLIALLTLGVL